MVHFSNLQIHDPKHTCDKYILFMFIIMAAIGIWSNSTSNRVLKKVIYMVWLCYLTSFGSLLFYVGLLLGLCFWAAWGVTLNCCRKELTCCWGNGTLNFSCLFQQVLDQTGLPLYTCLWNWHKSDFLICLSSDHRSHVIFQICIDTDQDPSFH